MWPHRRQPTRLPRPWDSPGKNTGVGCNFLLQCMKVKSESEVTQSCPTLSNPGTAAYQAPPSMGFSRQEYWSGVPLKCARFTHKLIWFIRWPCNTKEETGFCCCWFLIYNIKKPKSCFKDTTVNPGLGIDRSLLPNPPPLLKSQNKTHKYYWVCQKVPLVFK